MHPSISRQIGKQILNTQPSLVLTFLDAAASARSGDPKEFRRLELFFGELVQRAGKIRVRVRAGREAV